MSTSCASAFRGGARVIHYRVHIEDGDRRLRENYIVHVYLKSVQADLSPAEYATIRKAATEQRKRRLAWFRKRGDDND